MGPNDNGNDDTQNPVGGVVDPNATVTPGDAAEEVDPNAPQAPVESTEDTDEDATVDPNASTATTEDTNGDTGSV